MENQKDYRTEDIQEKLLEILLYFKSFCDSQNLKFVLAGGTCLGTARHKGFIPWDDDVDVFMLREDYERLMPLWNQYADTSRYSCVRSNEEINIHHSATEIKDNNTTFINKHSQDVDMHQGLMIDVIPLDNISASKFGRMKQQFYSLLYCCFNFQRLPEHKSKGIYYATKLALGTIRSPKSRYRIWKFAETQMVKLGKHNDGLVASFGEGLTIMKQVFPRKWVEKPAFLQFEGTDMPVPEDYDAWLTMSYGDYMTLPPESERILRHNAVFIDLENNYEKYKGIYYCKNEDKR